MGLDPLGMPGLAQRLIGRLAIGDALPPLGNSDATTATALATYLKCRPQWNSLRQEIAATGGKLSVYSCRHGFALRAAQLYGLSPRVTAALMGHSLQSHVNHYGHWTNADTLDEAVAAGVSGAHGMWVRNADEAPCRSSSRGWRRWGLALFPSPAPWSVCTRGDTPE